MGTRLANLDAGADVLKAEILLAQQGGVDKKVAASELPLPVNHISGLITSNNSTDADHDIDIATGQARDDADSLNLKLTSGLTKQIDAAWAVGTNAGGLDTGTVAADTLYAIWLIRRSDTGVVDALFSTSFSSPTMPTNYDKKRLIAAVITDGSANILEYIQVGDDFTFDTGIQVTTATSSSWGTRTLTSIKAPPGCIATLLFDLTLVTPTADANVSAAPADFSTYNLLRNSVMKRRVDTNGDYSTGGRLQAPIQISSGQQFYWAVEGAGTSYNITIYLPSFHMTTRREP